jgi:predicted O-methyltransferase YrrM
MIDLSKALIVEGWMSEPELIWLAEQAQKSLTTVEIGAWMGRSTRAMADNTSGNVIAVDTWDGSAENQESLKGKPHGYLFQKFCDNLADHIASGRVLPMRGNSLAVAAHCAEEGLRFGMIFIDAAHDYESVRNDILAWRPLLAKNGLLCGHDYDWGWPGVVNAVRELVSPVPDQAAGGSSIWFKQY